MKPLYRCEHCDFVGTEDEVLAHEITCEKRPELIVIKEKLGWIQEHCPHCCLRAQDYEIYIACALKKGWDNDCDVSFDCLQYCEGENLWEKM